jgi:hypothetical protein
MNRIIKTTLAALAASICISSCEDLIDTGSSGDPRDKLVDTWKVEENPGPFKSVLEIYWVEIAKHPFDSTRIRIYNFYNVDAEAVAILDGNDLILPEQELKGGFTVNGTGTVQGSKANEIIWTYFVDDGSGEVQSVQAVYTRLTF